jgi:DNA-binding HxlR family transcriptional regulator
VTASGPRECSVAAALDVIGEKWSLLVVRELFLGSRKFNDIAANTGAPRDVLTARLRRLEDLGVIERRVYSERPLRHIYVLTDKGKDLRPVMMTLKHWGDVHVRGRTMSPVYEHTCGEVFAPAVHCAACGDGLDPRSLMLRTAGATPAVGPARTTEA